MVVLALTLAAFCVRPVSAKPKKEEITDVGFRAGWGGCYRPHEWTPIEIDVNHTFTKPIAATVYLSVQQDEMNMMELARKLVLTPDVSASLALVAKFDYQASECEVTIRDDNGRRLWRKSYRLWEYSGGQRVLDRIGDEEMLIAFARGRSSVSGSGAFGLAHLPARSISITGSNRGAVNVAEKLPRALPDDWTGYAGLDALVLYDIDWSRMSRHQARAVAQWVMAGGSLLIVLGSHPLPAEHPVARLLPLTIESPGTAALERSMLTGWGCDAVSTATVDRWRLKKAEGEGASSFGRVLSGFGGAGPPLFVHGHAGFGRVGVLAFDPAVVGGTQRENLAPFWIAHLQDLLTRRRMEFTSNDEREYSQNQYGRWFEVGDAEKGAGHVLNHLLHIPELRPLSIWWVIGLLVTMAVLIGPVNYLVLKMVGRLPLTYVVSLGFIALFTVGARYAVPYIRSGPMRVRAVSVTDGVEGGAEGWSTTYLGLYAPLSDDYKLTGAQAESWWSATTPMESEEVYLGNYDYQWRTASRSVYYYQADGGNVPYSVPVSIYSMQCLVSQQRGEVGFRAEVRREGKRLVVRVVNTSDAPIRGGYVRLAGNMLLPFDTVPANSERTFEGELTRAQDWSNCLGRYYDPWRSGSYAWGVGGGDFDRDAAFFARGCLARTRAIESLLDEGAAVVCAEFEAAPVAIGVKGRQCKYDHIRLARLVVFPEVEEY